jgi:hypothetical protein
VQDFLVLTGIHLFDYGLDLIWTVGSGSDGVGRLGTQSGGATHRRRGGAAGDGGSSPGKARKCAPGLGFERGLHWEVPGSTGNPSRGLGAAELAEAAARPRAAARERR